MARIVAIANQKGGVGKTTTAYHLARAATLRGLRVLVIDSDPQGNLSRLLSQEALPADQVSLADVLLSRDANRPASAEPVLLSDIVVAGLWENLDVAPAVGDTLSYARDQLVISGAGREHKLRESLEEIQGDYDLILIDCPPSLDQLTLNALTAADGVLVITHTRLLSLDGMSQLVRTIENVRRYNNQRLRILGVAVNQFEKDLKAARHWLLELQEAAKAQEWPVLASMPKRTLIANVTETGEALDEQGSIGVDLAQIYDRNLTALMEGAQA
ncbi:ParA family protein [Kocuria palustris]|uniref:ParA family protein n=1 Tax=Kocuria palustris TaxID=71999 RepID=UPI003D720A66